MAKAKRKSMTKVQDYGQSQVERESRCQGQNVQDQIQRGQKRPSPEPTAKRGPCRPTRSRRLNLVQKATAAASALTAGAKFRFLKMSHKAAEAAGL